MSRERRITEAFVELAGTAASQDGNADFLRLFAQRCVDLIDAAGATVMLADEHGRLGLAATSSPAIRLAEVTGLRVGSGPGPEAYALGRPVACPDLDAPPERWHGFAVAARAEGYASAHAWPLRDRDEVLGGVELYRTTTGPYDEPDAELAEALAHVAAISLLRERRQQRADVLTQQLQQALDSRLVIEQAKGVLAERRSLGIDQAFVLLRGHARRHQMRLATLAGQVLDGTADGSLLGRPDQRSGGRGPAHPEPARTAGRSPGGRPQPQPPRTQPGRPGPADLARMSPRRPGGRPPAGQPTPGQPRPGQPRPDRP
ncbi:GAF and ANTAR domain-containing protein [Actinopolymorpha sp. NPDC004070]|uniref:GAF and ANTAR domain-containing protein n=1 Tax=Actinopolymorpha sp. NPDC004070 TaxID=3154548 RepID=UPI0033A7EB0A